MGHHIDSEGRFQSDKHRDLKPDKVIIDLTDPRAWRGLIVLAHSYREDDDEFACDLLARVSALRNAHPREIIAKLLMTLPLCDDCGQPATRVGAAAEDDCHGSARRALCDACDPGITLRDEDKLHGDAVRHAVAFMGKK